MNISIIGAGNMARGIGTRFIAGGHAVTVTGRDQSKATELAAALRASRPGAEAVATTTQAALANEVIVLALPFRGGAGFRGGQCRQARRQGGDRHHQPAQRHL